MGRPKTATLFLTFTACFLAVSTALAGNWPRFRGPNGTGVASDREIPVKWADGDILWKVAVPGVGNSSPIVWDNRLFLQTASMDGKERELLCLDAADGKVLWSRGVGGTRVKTHDKNTLASGTPATDGERVYTVFWDGDRLSLYAHDFKGEQLWIRDLGTFTSQHGAGHSPMVCGDRVIVADDQDGSARLIAVDARTGKDAWSVARKAFRACYSTPFLREGTSGAPELIVASTAGITAYDPKDGHVNWNFTWSFDGMALRTVASPIALGDLVFASSGDGNGSRYAIAVRPAGKGELGREALVWENKKNLDMPYVPTMLAHGEHLYFVNDKGFAGCIEAKTGRQLWFERLSQEFVASPVLIDGKVYAPDVHGNVFVFAAEPKFHLLAKNTLGEPVSASPAVVENHLFIRGQKHLYCVGKVAGK